MKDTSKLLFKISVLFIVATMTAQDKMKKVTFEYIHELTTLKVDENYLNTNNIDYSYYETSESRVQYGVALKYNIISKEKFRLSPFIGFMILSYPFENYYVWTGTSSGPWKEYGFAGISVTSNIAKKVSMGIDSYLPVASSTTRNSTEFLSIRPNVTYTILNNPWNELAIKLGYNFYVTKNEIEPGLINRGYSKYSVTGISLGLVFDFSPFRGRAKTRRTENYFRKD